MLSFIEERRSVVLDKTAKAACSKIAELRIMTVTGGLEVVAEGLVAIASGCPATCITGIVYVADVDKIIPIGDGACVTYHALNGIDGVNPRVIRRSESTALSSAAVGIAFKGEDPLRFWLADGAIRSHTCANEPFYARKNAPR